MSSPFYIHKNKCIFVMRGLADCEVKKSEGKDTSRR